MIKTNDTVALVKNVETNVIMQKTELQNLQNKYHMLLAQYEEAEANLNNATKSFVFDTEVDTMAGQNVFVSQLVTDPDSTKTVYLGSYKNTGKISPLGSNMSFKTCKEAALFNGNTVFALSGAKAGIESSAQCLGSNSPNDFTSGGSYKKSYTDYNDGTYGDKNTVMKRGDTHTAANAIYRTFDKKYIGPFLDKDAPNQAMIPSGPVMDSLPYVYSAGRIDSTQTWGNHSNFPDPNAEWIWYTANSQNNAPNNANNPVTLIYYFKGNGTYQSANLYLLIDDTVDIYLNSNFLGTAQDVFESNIDPFQMKIQLTPGDNYIMASVQNNHGGPAGLCMTCLATENNSFIFHTDSTWKYTPIHPTKMIPESETYSIETCQQMAKTLGNYTYFGVQGDGPDRSLCYFSNNLSDATKYGSAIQEFYGADNQVYGGTGVSAVYQVDPIPDTNIVGKVGYLNGQNQVSEYPDNMLNVKKNNQYIKIANADNPSGDNAIDSVKMTKNAINGGEIAADIIELFLNPIYAIIMLAIELGLMKSYNFQPDSYTNYSLENCESKCNSTGRCQAFVYDSSKKECKLKGSKSFPKTRMTHSSTSDLYYTPYTVNSNSSCAPQVHNIDAIQWAKYQQLDQQRTPSDLCGLADATYQPQRHVDELRNQLIDITQQLIYKSDSLGSLNSDILNKIGIDKKTFYDDLEQYRRLLRKLKSIGKTDNQENEFVRETQLSATQANYSLMLWSVLAVIALMILIYFWKK